MFLFKEPAALLNEDGTHQANPAVPARRPHYDDLLDDKKEGAKVILSTTYGIEGQNLPNLIRSGIQRGSMEEKNSHTELRAESSRLKTQTIGNATEVLNVLRKKQEFHLLHDVNLRLERLDISKEQASETLMTMYTAFKSAVDVPMILKSKDTNCQKIHVVMKEVFAEVLDMLWTHVERPHILRLPGVFCQRQRAMMYDKFDTITHPGVGVSAAIGWPSFQDRQHAS